MRKPEKATKAIAEKVLLKNQEVPGAALPEVNLLARRMNSTKQAAVGKIKVPDADDIFFPINTEGFPEGFFCDAVTATSKGEERRHLIFGTQVQLRMLSNLKRWFMDGTFKLVARPFRQLYSIHGFIKGENKNKKQEAFLHVFMTRRRTEDYVAVFTYLKQILHAPQVVEFVSDFETAVWLAVDKCFPKKNHHKGCNFHFGQAIIRRVRKLGLLRVYKKDPVVRNIVQELLCLPYIKV